MLRQRSPCLALVLISFRKRGEGLAYLGLLVAHALVLHLISFNYSW